jgi:hypothetical protein
MGRTCPKGGLSWSPLQKWVDVSGKTLLSEEPDIDELVALYRELSR